MIYGCDECWCGTYAIKSLCSNPHQVKWIMHILSYASFHRWHWSDLLQHRHQSEICRLKICVFFTLWSLWKLILNFHHSSAALSSPLLPRLPFRFTLNVISKNDLEFFISKCVIHFCYSVHESYNYFIITLHLRSAPDIWSWYRHIEIVLDERESTHIIISNELLPLHALRACTNFRMLCE